MKIDANDLAFLQQMARDVIDASRVKPGQRIGDSPANALGHTVIRPGGRDCYPAMWVRDFSMSIDCGLIDDAEVRTHFDLIASKQNGAAERKLKSSAIIPPFAIPDHINFDGGAVFYPGTYSAGEDQGGEPFGVLPPADDHFEFVRLAHRLKIDSDAAHRAFDAVECDDATGMVRTSPHRRAVGFGFNDAIYLTGSMLFASLLRHRAALELGKRDIAAKIEANLVSIFADEKRRHGWLLASTEVGRQPDVWGTIYALHRNVLPNEFANFARHTVADALKRRTITYNGAVRHIPTDHDFSPASAWERTMPGLAVNTYQNGAYWHTPTGWLISALRASHPELSQQVWTEYIAHLREQDFRRGASFGAPWECFGKDGKAQQNPVYMASVTLPLSVVQQLEG